LGPSPRDGIRFQRGFFHDRRSAERRQQVEDRVSLALAQRHTEGHRVEARAHDGGAFGITRAMPIEAAQEARQTSDRHLGASDTTIASG